jgi:hypothetical protein
MNSLKISVDIKNIIIKYTLPPINRAKELKDDIIFNIGEIECCLNGYYVLNNDRNGIISLQNFNNVKYKYMKPLNKKRFWILRIDSYLNGNKPLIY